MATARQLNFSQKRSVSSHLVAILLFIKVIIIIVIIIRRFVFLLGFLFLGLRVVLFLFLSFLNFRKRLPFLCEVIGFSAIISDDDVVEDGATLHLPEIETDEAKVSVLIDAVVVLVLGVVDLPCRPHTFVCRVRDSLHEPLSLEIWIVFHWSLPLTILLIIPIFGLLGVCIHNALSLDPILGLLVLRIV